MHSKPIQAACLIAGAILYTGLQPTASAQDANRDMVVTKTEVRDVVQRLVKRTAEFKEEFNKAVEHSMIDGTKLEDKAKHRADDLHDAAKKLNDVFGDKKDKNNPAVRDQVDKTLAAGADVNKIMKDNRFTDKAQRDWEVVRTDLSALAAVYQLSPL